MIKYKYNSEGLREVKLGEREVRYLLDGLAVLCEYDGEGIKREYVEGVSMKENNQKYYYIYDRLGNVRYVLDENGAIVKSYSYSPFGQIHSFSGSLSQPYQFVGGEFYYKEEELGLYLLGQRWYDGEVGRFISRDPIGEEGGLNLYVYVGNNCVNKSDPEGKTVEEVIRDCKLGCDIHLSGPPDLQMCCLSLKEYVSEEIPGMSGTQLLKECTERCMIEKGHKPGVTIYRFMNCLSTKLWEDAILKLIEKILENII